MPGMSATKSASKYWDLTPPTAGTLTADLAFTYLDSDVGSTNEADYRVWKDPGTGPVDQCDPSPCVDTVTNTVTLAGVSSFSRWTAAEALALAPSAAPVGVSGRCCIRVLIAGFPRSSDDYR